MQAGNGLDANGNRDRQASTIECDAVWDLLTVYADGEATEHERAMVEQHLAQCANCRSDLEFLRLSSNALQSVCDVEPPAALAGNILSATVHRPAMSSRMAAAVRRAMSPAPARYGALIAAGAAAALSIVALQGTNRIGAPVVTMAPAGTVASAPTPSPAASPARRAAVEPRAIGAEGLIARPAVRISHRAGVRGAAVAMHADRVRVASGAPVRTAAVGPRVAPSVRKPAWAPSIAISREADRTAEAAPVPEPSVKHDQAAPAVAVARAAGAAGPASGEGAAAKPAVRPAHIVLTASGGMNPGQIASLASYRRDQRGRSSEWIGREVAESTHDRQIRLDVIHGSF